MEGQRVGEAGEAAFRPRRARRVHRRRAIARRRADQGRRSARPKSSSPDGHAIPRRRWSTRESRWPARSARRRRPGDYPIEVTAAEKGKPLGTARARFTVFPQDLELDNASADASAMESLAAMTGGQSLAPEQLPELDRAARPRRRNTWKSSRRRRRRSGTSGRFFSPWSDCWPSSGICGSDGGWCRKGLGS